MERACLVFDAPRCVSIQREPVSAPPPGAALVQTTVSAISAGTEMLFYRGQVPQGLCLDTSLPALAGEVRYPLSYGYACVGRVVEIGAQVEPEWLGRTVFAFQPHASHFVAPVCELLPVPEGIADEQAVFLPNMETAVNLVMDGAPLLGERVVVLGQGVVGLLTTALLAQMPLAALTTVDAYPLRCKLSRALGALRALDLAKAEACGESADLTFEVSGNPAALDLALARTGFAGRIVIGSWYGEKRAPVNFGGDFHRSRIRLISSQVSTVAPELTGRWTKARRLDVAWAMLARVPLAPLITDRVPFRDAAQAYARLDQHPEQTVQVLLEYDR